MKKTKFWALTALCATVVLTAGTAVGCKKHAHDYGEWKFTTTPTEDAAGKASRDCKSGDGSEEVEVSKLTDTSVWTLQTTPSTHEASGKKVYSSQYGNVEVAIPKGEHTYTGSAWTITVAPTLSESGKAEQKCSANDSGKNEKDIPALSDESVWTKATTTAPTHVAKGKDTYTSVYGSVEVETDQTAHTFEGGAWTITVDPTLTTKGKAKQSCTADDGGTHEISIPELSDVAMWTKTTTAATHVKEGRESYVSIYGTVNVPTATTPHTFEGSAWTITTAPTLTTKGKAERACTANDNGKEEKEISSLSDKTVWKKTIVTAATGTTAGKHKYTSVYGEVEIDVPAMNSPFLNKTYYNFAIELDANNPNKALSTETAWDAAHVAINGEGAGTADAYPFRNSVQMSMVDSLNAGEMEFAVTDGTTATYTSFIDSQTGIIVVLFSSSRIFVLTPYTRLDGQTTRAVSDIKASTWGYKNKSGVATNSVAIAYTYAENKTLNIYIDGDNVVHFGVSFANLDGTKVDADKMFSLDVQSFEDYFKVVKNASGSVIETFGPANGLPSLALCDEYLGTYKQAGKPDMFITGTGVIMLGSVVDPDYIGTYKVVDDKVQALITPKDDATTEYYVYTVDRAAKTYTGVKPMVAVVLNGGTYGNTQNKSYNVNVPVKLPDSVSTNEAYLFVGYFTDATTQDQTTAVELDANGNYIPTGTGVTTLYAGWKKAVAIKVKVNPDEAFELKHIPEDSAIGTCLPKLGIEVENQRFFAGWYTSATTQDETTAVSVDATVSFDSDNGIEIFAKWNVLPAYYGEYNGKQLLSSGTDYTATVKIDEFGNITGSVFANDNAKKKVIDGVVKSYNATTQVLTWAQKADQDTVYTMWYDSASGTLVAVVDGGVFTAATTQMGQYPFVLVKSGTVGENKSFDYHVETPKVGKTKLIQIGDSVMLMYNNKVYANVSLFNAFDEVVTFADADKTKTLVVKNADGEVIVAFGTTAEDLTKPKDPVGTNAVIAALDEYYGKYTIGGVEYRLDGTGTISWTVDGKTHSGSYTLQEGETAKFDVYEREIKSTTTTSTGTGEDDYGEETTSTTKRYVNVAYYVLTLGDTPAIDKPMVTLTVTSSQPVVESLQANKNIVYTPAKLDDTTTHVFRGWYTNADFSTALPADFTPTADTTIYAKWLEKVTVTLDYKYEVDGVNQTQVIVLGKGEKLEFTELVRTGYKISAWYTDAALTDGNEWTETTATATKTVYAKWVEAPVYSFVNYYTMHVAETYTSVKVDNKNVSLPYGTDTKDARGLIKFDANGVGKGTGWPLAANNSTVTNLVKNEAEGYGTLNYNNSTIGGDMPAYIDLASNMIVVAYGAANKTTFLNFEILVPNCTSTNDIPSSDYKESFWEGGLVRAITFKAKDTNYSLFIYKGKVYFNVTFKTILGTTVEANEAYKAETLFVRKANGDLIAKFGYNGTTMQELDGTEGTYACTGKDNLVFTGTGKFTWGTKTGVYTAVENQAGVYNMLVKVDDKNAENYNVTLDATAKTYSLTENKVTITYTTEHGTQDGQSVWKDVEFTLPKLANVATHVFRGWHVGSDTENLLLGESKYTPTANTTLTAKWDIKVTLTVVYGKYDIPNATLEYGAGDTVVPVEPPYTNGEAFGGWYNDAAFTDAYTIGKITENKTIYCKWISAVPMFGTYYGWNLFGPGAKDISATTDKTGTKLIISPAGVITGDKSGTVAKKEDNSFDYDPATGIFYVENSGKKYYFVYDEASKAVICGYTLNETGLNDDANLFFAKFIKSGTNSQTLGTGGNLKGGKLATITFADDTTVNFFITNTRIYSGVTWTATNADCVETEYTPKTIENATTVIVRDKDGNILIARGKKASDWIDLDGYQGSYTGELGALTVDGVGAVKLAGVETAGKYTLAAADAGYTAEVYVNNCYYLITLDKTNKTYTYTKPMVTVTYSTDYDAEHAVSGEVNKNIEITLPTLTSTTHTFRGWLIGDSTTVTKGNTTYKPTADITLTAKWDINVTLTVVYGNGLDNATLTYGAGDTAAPVKPELTSGQVFDGWYTDSAFTQAYTPGAITENTTIYVKWKVAHVMAGTYKGVNFGSGSSYSKKVWTSMGTTVTVTPEGAISGGKKNGNLVADATLEKVYRVEGNASYIWCDAEAGVIAEAWNANNTGFNKDMMIYFKKEVVKLYGSDGLTTDGWTGVLTAEFKDGTKMNVLVYNNKVYCNVTWDITVTPDQMAIGTNIVVKDSSNNTIVTITNRVATAG